MIPLFKIEVSICAVHVKEYIWQKIVWATLENKTQKLRTKKNRIK